jgi:hypothetical protein
VADAQAVELRSVELVNEALEARAAELAGAGLRAGPIEVVRGNPSSGYSSEVSCWLYRGDAPEEFIEFEVFRSDVLIVDLETLPSWLDELLVAATGD